MTMLYRRLGRTELSVSAFGLGTGGGGDPLGQNSGRSLEQMIGFIHTAYDLGINLFDTSPGYGESEVILGKALAALPADRTVVSSKVPLAGGMPGQPLRIMPAGEIEHSVDRSLRRLQREQLDILFISVADASHYERVTNEHLPVLLRLKEKGKIRFLGSSEQTRSDGHHSWLRRILPDNVLDVVMVGHNMLNQSAARTVFPLCRHNDIGVVNVFTVRNVFSQPARLREVVADLTSRGVIDPGLAAEAPLDWLTGPGKASDLIEVAYRYALFARPVTSVMTGTIDAQKLRQNVALIDKGPLPDADLARLHDLFGRVEESVGN